MRMKLRLFLGVVVVLLCAQPTWAQVANDTFTGTASTDLTAHTPDSGGSWSHISGFTGTIVLTNAGRARLNNGLAQSAYYDSATPSTNEYSVDVDCVLQTNIAFNYYDIWARLITTSATGYQLEYDTSAATWYLRSVVTGSGSELGNYPQALTPGVTYHVKLQILTGTKKVFIDGVERISSTDDSLTATGHGGLDGYASTGLDDSTGMHWDNFIVTDVASTRPGSLLLGIFE